MGENFKYGLKGGILYYLIAAASICSSYFLFGNDYGHVPGPYFLIGILFLLGGTGWMFYYLVLLLSGYKAKVNFGVLTIHIVVIFSVILLVWIDRSISDVAEYKTNPADILTISQDVLKNTSSIVDGKGDTLYSKKGDSILINKLTTDTNNIR